jgi:hypothetical protein
VDDVVDFNPPEGEDAADNMLTRFTEFGTSPAGAKVFAILILLALLAWAWKRPAVRAIILLLIGVFLGVFLFSAL